ncbi:hypothetical protein CDAR_121381 [Caerostris darwini]|uniref:Transposase n=1 Tax=Caerostris darwini TaxID=1538125 RepID=A0AAV4W1J8_9ARAC|nr:hypothetical protein CDAR_121381 [Caerostris darwini]
MVAAGITSVDWCWVEISASLAKRSPGLSLSHFNELLLMVFFGDTSGSVHVGIWSIILDNAPAHARADFQENRPRPAGRKMFAT